MYIINKELNIIEPIDEATFKALGFREREHLQEWISKYPKCLNEDLLIIQKEFSGFAETNERLDLLALDKQGNLVIIENKLDSSGKDVTWQVLKYASYCSSLSSEEIIQIFNQYLKDNSAREKMEEFFENDDDYEQKLNQGNSQRIIMIAAEFKKEVTSTVLWLKNYGLRIQCFKTTPYKMGEQLLLDFNQIIPIPEAEDYIISMANKNRDNIVKQEELKTRHHVRFEFWQMALQQVNKTSQLFSNVNPSKDNWLNAGSGMSGVVYSMVITKSNARVELNIYGRGKDENKQVFDYLFSKKAKIEEQYGSALLWNRNEEKTTSNIVYMKDDVSIFNREDWDKMIDFFKKEVPKLESTFKKHIHDVNKLIKA